MAPRKKYDGYRILLAVGGEEGRAYTRSGPDWSKKFETLTGDAVKIIAGSELIDGEAVVLETNGRSSFQSLQTAINSDPASVIYYAFDLFSHNGEDLTGLPLVERMTRLRRLIPRSSRLSIRTSSMVC